LLAPLNLIKNLIFGNGVPKLLPTLMKFGFWQLFWKQTLTAKQFQNIGLSSSTKLYFNHQIYNIPTKNKKIRYNYLFVTPKYNFSEISMTSS